MSLADARRCTPASRGVTQLSLFDLAPSPAHEPAAPVTAVVRAQPAARPEAGRLVDGASFWAVSFAGDTRGQRERLSWASARYHARFGRAHALVAVPLAELDAYRAAGIEAVGDGRLAQGCLYLLHPTGDPESATEEAT